MTPHAPAPGAGSQQGGGTSHLHLREPLNQLRGEPLPRASRASLARSHLDFSLGRPRAGSRAGLCQTSTLQSWELASHHRFKPMAECITTPNRTPTPTAVTTPRGTRVQKSVHEEDHVHLLEPRTRACTHTHTHTPGLRTWDSGSVESDTAGDLPRCPPSAPQGGAQPMVLRMSQGWCETECSGESRATKSPPGQDGHRRPPVSSSADSGPRRAWGRPIRSAVAHGAARLPLPWVQAQPLSD